MSNSDIFVIIWTVISYLVLFFYILKETGVLLNWYIRRQRKKIKDLNDLNGPFIDADFLYGIPHEVHVYMPQKFYEENRQFSHFRFIRKPGGFDEHIDEAIKFVEKYINENILR